MEAQALGIGSQALVCAHHGLSLADGHPIAVFESVFPVSRLPGITAALREITRA